MGYSAQISGAIVEFTSDLPAAVVDRLADICLACGREVTPSVRGRLMAVLHHERPKRQMGALLDLLVEEGVAPELIAYGLACAAQTQRRLREAQSVSLLWTGPDSPKIPVRRNEQALLDLIAGAKQILHIVSYVAYKADDVLDALWEAVGRGVAVHLYLETMDKNGKARRNGLEHIGKDLAMACTLYEWPLAVRERTPQGNVGALHAKLAVADGSQLFVSSANLTGYAMHHNMEMGVLFAGGEEPAVVQAHLGKLVEMGVFRPFEATANLFCG